MELVQRAWHTIKSSFTLQRLIRRKPPKKSALQIVSTSESTTDLMPAGAQEPQARAENADDVQERPTIQKAIQEYAERFLEACEGNILGNVSSTIIRFVKTPGLPPYYHFKCYIILAAAREEETAEANVAVGKHYIAKAREAHVRGKELYVHDPRDKLTLEALRKCIDEEWAALRAYEKNEVYRPEDQEDNWPLNLRFEEEQWWINPEQHI
ncbi:Hypothetical predicted protein [Lecanosticta acicola]|uniref:Uncharacterized protein n=1 Tax=Lecanosticta acicola TaxID=111012 RepID=A0AAI9ECC7_9PEZI|nr:Hypothetical predicted protein [Lecanosticta acicola]